jgi:DNA-binding transcriptional LysR family regulator
MHQIRYFLAVADTLNFTRAAEECHVAQPSLSRAIGKLEQELGGDLFRRERNRTHLTDLGRAMQPLLRQSFESAAAAKSEAASYASADRIPLRIGLSLTVHLDVIAPMLEELSRLYEGLELHLERAAAPEILASLEAGEIELAVAADKNAAWDRLDRWPMFEEGFVLLSPPHHRGTATTLSAIDDKSVIERPYCETLAVYRPDVATDRGAPRQRHAVSSDEDAAHLAKCGMGFAILPESSGRLLSASVQAIDDLDVVRTVVVFAVAGRARSSAAGGMLKLLRAADWTAVPPR